MKNLQKLLVIFLASISILAAGCGGSGGPPPPPTPPWFGAQGAPNFAISTTVGPVSSSAEAWKNVTIQGWDVEQYACNPGTDSACIMEVGGPYLNANPQNKIGSFNTNSYGQANFGTTAIGDEWNFYATDNGSTECNQGTASITTIQGGTFGEPVNLSCNANDADMVATPSSCAPGACPATITLAYPPPLSSTFSLPLHTELTAAVFNGSGTNLGQSNEQASSTTSVVVPTPTAYGKTFIGVYNPAGSLVGVSEFAIVSPPETCSQKSMPYGDGSGVVTTCLQIYPGLVEGDVDVTYDNGNYNGYVSGIITLIDQTSGYGLGTNSDIKDYGEADADFQQVGNLVEGHTYQACGTGYIGINGQQTKVCVSVIYSE